MHQTNKPKSVGKIALPRSEQMEKIVLKTLEKTARIVGSTLGPFGQPVLLERPELNMKPIVTKDGVTVFKHLGYHDSIEQVVLEAARDAVVRTAQEAGDGTTNSTILSYSITKSIQELSKNSGYSPQRLVRAIYKLIPEIESFVSENSILANNENYDEILHKVGTLSANGDTEISDIIMDCFDSVGENGNIIITEDYGQPGYKVEKVNGFTVEKGFEESAENFYSQFLNAGGGTKTYLEKPAYLLFDGNVQEPNNILFALKQLDAAYQSDPEKYPTNFVIVAHSFGKEVLQWLAYNFIHGKFKIFPLKSEQSISLNSQTAFLHDVAAYVGAKVYNPMSNPIQQAELEDLIKGRSDAFEAGRFRSTIIGTPDPTMVQFRVEELQSQVANGEAVYDRREAEVRIAKLTCGIAKVKVLGPSQVEIREKKDRVEDAWCAVRSAVKSGALPGGGWTLLKLSKYLPEKFNSGDISVAAKILAEAFLAPVRILFQNAGYNKDEMESIHKNIIESHDLTYDIQEGKFVPLDGILDSAAAVLEAIRNSVSVATMMGTLGGVVVFKRDSSADTEDGSSMREYKDALDAAEAYLDE